MGYFLFVAMSPAPVIRNPDDGPSRMFHATKEGKE
jgi:hypothetical protein